MHTYWNYYVIQVAIILPKQITDPSIPIYLQSQLFMTFHYNCSSIQPMPPSIMRFSVLLSWQLEVVKISGSSHMISYNWSLSRGQRARGPDGFHKQGKQWLLLLNPLHHLSYQTTAICIREDFKSWQRNTLRIRTMQPRTGRTMHLVGSNQMASL